MHFNELEISNETANGCLHTYDKVSIYVRYNVYVLFLFYKGVLFALLMTAFDKNMYSDRHNIKKERVAYLVIRVPISVIGPSSRMGFIKHLLRNLILMYAQSSHKLL